MLNFIQFYHYSKISFILSTFTTIFTNVNMMMFSFPCCRMYFCYWACVTFEVSWKTKVVFIDATSFIQKEKFAKHSTENWQFFFRIVSKRTYRLPRANHLKKNSVTTSNVIVSIIFRTKDSKKHCVWFFSLFRCTKLVVWTKIPSHFVNLERVGGMRYTCIVTSFLFRLHVEDSQWEKKSVFVRTTNFVQRQSKKNQTQLHLNSICLNFEYHGKT